MGPLNFTRTFIRGPYGRTHAYDPNGKVLGPVWATDTPGIKYRELDSAGYRIWKS